MYNFLYNEFIVYLYCTFEQGDVKSMLAWSTTKKILSLKYMPVRVCACVRQYYLHYIILIWVCVFGCICATKCIDICKYVYVYIYYICYACTLYSATLKHAYKVVVLTPKLKCTYRYTNSTYNSAHKEIIIWRNVLPVRFYFKYLKEFLFISTEKVKVR